MILIINNTMVNHGLAMSSCILHRYMFILILVFYACGLYAQKSIAQRLNDVLVSKDVKACEKLFPLENPLTDQRFLEFCFAVILPAIGSAIVFNIGASTGGTDIIAMILNKHTSLEIGKSLLISDLGIVLIAAYLYGASTGLYCILGMILKCTVVDSAIESLNLRKVCTVISSEPEKVKQFIMEQLRRTATEQEAHGAYSNNAEKVLMTVLTRREAALLRNFIRKEDPHAFITIVNSSEIIGKGFRSI